MIIIAEFHFFFKNVFSSHDEVLAGIVVVLLADAMEEIQYYVAALHDLQNHFMLSSWCVQARITHIHRHHTHSHTLTHTHTLICLSFSHSRTSIGL